ncbi:MAG: UDP-N-acetylmuramoyl-L-alanine--D-glutamate ligase [Clostridia bacterium]|nr:UDP-N-acetylmuramoyl-L-alanine--D-glutamate ligase [Clostridia bacterium]
MTVNEYLIKKFKNKKCNVLGFARSNKPLVDMLLQAGAQVTVRDRNEKLLLDSEAVSFASRGAVFTLGEQYLAELRGDYIFRTPAIRHDLPQIAEAVKGGAVLTSEMELFLEVCPCPVLGITGSDGKTTTTTVTHLLLETEMRKRGSGKAYIGGNIGAPLLPLVGKMTAEDVAVVELSSFQLQTMTLSPSRAVITNITPNHLNWHTDMDEYISAKCNICRHAPVSMLVANAENAVTREIAKNSDLPVTYFSSKASSYGEIVPFFKENCNAIYEKDGVIFFEGEGKREAVLTSKDILLPGRHNVENYMAAIALTRGLVSNDTVREVATSFGGVEHRLELVRTHRGVTYYNSSIDSSPTRTAAALSALPKAPVIICGGSDKNIPFDGLARDLCTRTKAVVLTGEAASKILTEIEKCPLYDPARLVVKHIPEFKDAVLSASALAESGDAVLLSPACASFDRFRDFAERGNYFKEIVNGL